MCAATHELHAKGSAWPEGIGKVSPILREHINSYHIRGAFLCMAAQELAQTGKVFVTGDAFSVADAHVAPVLARVTSLGRSELISSRPALQTYWECMQQRPSFKAVFPTGMK